MNAMKLFRCCKIKYRVWLGGCILAAAVLLVGCGKEQSQRQQQKELPKLSEEELSALQYLEKVELEDTYGDGAYYDAYGIKEGTVEGGMASYFGHGLTYFSSPINLGSTSELSKYLDDMVEYTMEDWQDEHFGNADDVELSKVKDNGEDKYQIASAMKENIFDEIKFETRGVFYLDVQKEGAGVFWSLEMDEDSVDAETELILDEIAACYQVDLSEIKTAVGEWLAAGKERDEERQDVYEPEEGDLVLEEVEGYQYMGVVTLTAGDGETKSPVMAPRGWNVSAWENRVSSYMHGVFAEGSLGIYSSQGFMKNVEGDIDISYGVYQKDEETYRNVRKTNMMPISGYEEALYVIFTYEELDSYTQEYMPRVKVNCYIKVSDDYMLEYDVKLFPEDYDGSTNTVIKELETAYGMDLSEYYNGEED